MDEEKISKIKLAIAKLEQCLWRFQMESDPFGWLQDLAESSEELLAVVKKVLDEETLPVWNDWDWLCPRCKYSIRIDYDGNGYCNRCDLAWKGNIAGGVPRWEEMTNEEGDDKWQLE